MSGDVFLHLKHKYGDLFTQYKENSEKKKERELSRGAFGNILVKRKMLFQVTILPYHTTM